MAGILLQGEAISDEQRAAHARQLAVERREISQRELTGLGPEARATRLERAVAIGGKVVQDIVIQPGHHWSGGLDAHRHLRIIDLEGRQAVDFLCYDRANLANRYNAANTLKLNRSIYISLNSKLYADNGEVLMVVVEDSVGFHDTIGGCCSSHVNYLRYGIRNTPNCRDNFVAALSRHGLASGDIPANVNFFMYVPVASDGAVEISEGRSLPGDFVDVRAEKDVVIAISNCPQLYNPCNGWSPTPIRLIEWEDD
jgi:urea carboxylase-associated protein 1